MELTDKEQKTLKLFLEHKEIARRHLTKLFPDKARSSKYQILRSLVNKGLIDLHKLATASYYTITQQGKEKLKELTST